MFFIVKLLKNQQLKVHNRGIISLGKLSHDYLFILISSVLVGLNSDIFTYTFDIAKTILPTENPEYFQYMVNIVSIIAPFIFGFIADKYGYMKTQKYALYMLTGVHFVSSFASYVGMKSIFVYYGLGFLDTVFSNCLTVSIMAIFGEYLLTQGIFRSFAIFGILFSIGTFLCGFIYEIFSLSFSGCQFYIGLTNVIFIVILLQNYKNFLSLKDK